MSAILFGKMRTQTIQDWKKGIGLEASFLKRKRLHFASVNVQPTIFDQYTEQEEVNGSKQSTEKVRRCQNNERLDTELL